MRRLAIALRSLFAGIARAIDVEGALILSGVGGLAFLVGTLDWRLGLAIVFSALLVAGIALARPAKVS